MTDQLPLFDFSDPAEEKLHPDHAAILGAAAALLDGSATDALLELTFHEALLKAMFTTWPKLGSEIAERRGYRSAKTMLKAVTDLEMRSILLEAFLALLPVKERAPTVVRLVTGMGISLDEFRGN